jgi:hypothetical protein
MEYGHEAKLSLCINVLLPNSLGTEDERPRVSRVRAPSIRSLIMDNGLAVEATPRKDPGTHYTETYQEGNHSPFGACRIQTGPS